MTFSTPPGRSVDSQTPLHSNALDSLGHNQTPLWSPAASAQSPSPPSQDTPHDASPFAMPSGNSFGSRAYRSQPSESSFQDSDISMGMITPLIVDTVAKDFQLEEWQRSILQNFVQLSTVGLGLQQADVLMRLYHLALQFHLFNRRFEGDENANSLKAMLADLKIRLVTSFVLTSDQSVSMQPLYQITMDRHFDIQKTIRLIAQELLYNPMRTCYREMDKDVFDYISERQKAMRFENIFGDPAREKVLEKEIARTCSSVRNGFRQHIRDSVENKTTLVNFTYAMNKIYCRAGGEKFSSQTLLLRNAILRRFIWDNPHSVWKQESVKDIASSTTSNGNEDDSAQPAGSFLLDEEEPSKKRRKLPEKTGGRIPKGKDFWSLVDKFYDEKKKEFGKKITDPNWKSYVDGVLKFDEAGFKDPQCIATGTVNMTTPTSAGPALTLTGRDIMQTGTNEVLGQNWGGNPTITGAGLVGHGPGSSVLGLLNRGS
ncbi:hypothetical protein VKT23_006540 [Stygiomarasmius scandens]|uniref:Uncharacterized protein n=1 Tax=Marasmiellus scandens TaxID=2682957 RepID=A0ABR1JNZ1_9AGAR